MVPTVQPQFSWFGGNDGGTLFIYDSYNDYALGTSIWTWEMDKRIHRHLKKANNSWRLDETYIKVKGQWMYLYRAVDSEGNTIDFYLSKTRDHKAAKRFLRKLCGLFMFQCLAL